MIKKFDKAKGWQQSDIDSIVAESQKENYDLTADDCSFDGTILSVNLPDDLSDEWVMAFAAIVRNLGGILEVDDA